MAKKKQTEQKKQTKKQEYTYKILGVVVIIIILVGLTLFYYNPSAAGGKENQANDINPETYCETDEDCACGVHVDTGECFYGNIEYVDETEECPDFCTGIVGNLGIECIEGVCTQVPFY